jgi:hypothetical protein
MIQVLQEEMHSKAQGHIFKEECICFVDLLLVFINVYDIFCVVLTLLKIFSVCGKSVYHIDIIVEYVDGYHVDGYYTNGYYGNDFSVDGPL